MTNRREFIKKILIGGGAALATPRLVSAQAVSELVGNSPWSYTRADGPWETLMPAILRRIKPPVFPKRDFLITRYGAVGDGQKDCTESFRQAITACNKAGG